VAAIDYAENVARGEEGWADSYLANAERRRAQIDAIMRFAESHHCRMSSLVQHFGDHADGGRCGICDFCADEDCVAQRFRDATENEREAARTILERGGALVMFPEGTRGADRHDLRRAVAECPHAHGKIGLRHGSTRPGSGPTGPARCLSGGAPGAAPAAKPAPGSAPAAKGAAGKAAPAAAAPAKPAKGAGKK